ncbi:cytochrome c5 family protein [Endozoicomonas sp. OPT23]|nr:cytochrome c5 family protein [Endozoicomonas sp. OPT23]
MRFIMALIGGLFSVMTFAAVELDDISRQEVAERIAPVTKVCLQGEECASNVGAAPVAASGPRTGEAVYGQFCSACHGAGILGAPKKGDSAAWNARLSEAGSFDSVVNKAIAGFNSMPPRGTCGDCSDEEFSNAVQFMSGLK